MLKRNAVAVCLVALTLAASAVAGVSTAAASSDIKCVLTSETALTCSAKRSFAAGEGTLPIVAYYTNSSGSQRVNGSLAIPAGTEGQVLSTVLTLTGRVEGSSVSWSMGGHGGHLTSPTGIGSGAGNDADHDHPEDAFGIIRDWGLENAPTIVGIIGGIFLVMLTFSLIRRGLRRSKGAMGI